MQIEKFQRTYLTFIIFFLIGATHPSQAKATFEGGSDLSPSATQSLAEFSENGVLSKSLVSNFLGEAQTRRAQIYKLVLNEENSAKKAEKNKTVLAFNIMIELASQLQTSTDRSQQALLATQIKELDFALRSEGALLRSAKMRNSVAALLKTWSVPKKAGQLPEAANLVNPHTSKVMTAHEATELAKRGTDLSALKSKFFGHLWRHPVEEIAKLNISKNYFEGGTSLYNGKILDVGIGARWELDSPRLSQTSPKININLFRDGKKVSKIKLKFGREFQSDPVVNSLMAAVGFSTDINRYLKNQKVYLAAVDYPNFLKEFTSYYNHDNALMKFDIHEYLAKHDVNGKQSEIFEDEGGPFILFKEAEMEAEDDEQIRVGEWSFAELGHAELREVRGLMLFNLWVANTDISDSRNQKLILKKSDAGYDWHFIQHDSGVSLGRIIGEEPNGFQSDLVRKNTDKEIVFAYSSFQPSSIANTITFADAKWATRLIAQLTRAQITEAVELGGWHPSISALYVEKLIRRRNQLVQGFGLEAEAGLLNETAKTLSTRDQVVMNGQVVKSKEFTGSVRDFNQYPEHVFGPLGSVLGRAIESGLQLGTGGGDLGKIEITKLQSSSPLFTSAIVDANRKIQNNPHPTSEKDRYLVSDVVKVGIRLGAGDVVGGDVSVQATYTLTYPARDTDEALKGDRQIINFDLPLDVIRDRLPRDENGKYNFVLSREVDLEGRGWVRTDSRDSPALLGAEASIGRVKLLRTVIDARSTFGSVLVHEDRSTYGNLAYRAYFRLLGLLKVSFMDGDIQKGQLEGRTFEIEDLDKANWQQALAEVLRHGNFNSLSALQKPLEETSAKFKTSRMRLSLPVFASLEIRKSRTDIKTVDANGATLKDLYQSRFSKKSRWSFFGRGEEAMVKINVQSPKSGLNGAAANWAAELSYAMVDKDTSSQELQSYLDFMNAVAWSTGDEKLIDFTPAAHSRNDRWEHQDVLVSLGYCQQGIENIFNSTREQFDEKFAQSLGISVEHLQKIASAYSRRMAVTPHGFASAAPSSFDREVESQLYARSLVIRELLRLKKSKASLQRLNTSIDNKALGARSKLVEDQSETLVRIFRQTSFRGQHLYKADILRALNLLAGPNNVEVIAQLSPSNGEESLVIGPKNRVITARSGGECLNANEAVILFPMDTIEQYNSLNWVRSIETEQSKATTRGPSSLINSRAAGQKRHPYYTELNAF